MYSPAVDYGLISNEIKPRIRYVPQWDGRMTQVAWYPGQNPYANPYTNPTNVQYYNGPYSIWGSYPGIGSPWGSPYYPDTDDYYGVPYRTLVCEGTQCDWQTVGLPRHRHHHHYNHRNHHHHKKHYKAKKGGASCTKSLREDPPLMVIDEDEWPLFVQ